MLGYVVLAPLNHVLFKNLATHIPLVLKGEIGE